MQSQVLLAADRVAFINPANGNTTPVLVTQGGQTFINEALIKSLIAPTIISGGNPPAFSLTLDGKLTAKNADISGSVNANSGTLNNFSVIQIESRRQIPFFSVDFKFRDICYPLLVGLIRSELPIQYITRSFPVPASVRVIFLPSDTAG